MILLCGRGRKFASSRTSSRMPRVHYIWISGTLLILLLLGTSQLLTNNVQKDVEVKFVTNSVESNNLKPSGRGGSHGAESRKRQGQTHPGVGAKALSTSKVDYKSWDDSVGCKAYRKKHLLETRSDFGNISRSGSLQNPTTFCNSLRQQHVVVLVKKWTWIPETLNNLYSCGCQLTCLWTNTDVLADQPDADLFESDEPPSTRRQGEPLRVYMDLEPGRKRAQSQDLFVSYHSGDSVQVTYAGAAFHKIRNYYISALKQNEVLVYWSSSRCVDERQSTARRLLPLLPYHSFGKCLNNVGGPEKIVEMYPDCSIVAETGSQWSQNLHCAMSHYKFVLAIENTRTESYVTEKLYYALDVGAIPIYFGAPNVLDFVPPHSIIEGFNFRTMQELADFVKKVAADPVLYAEYHAWRRCGVMGNYGQTRAISLDALPCRLCAAVSQLGGRDSPTST